MARELNTTPTSVWNWVRAEEKRTGQKIVLREHHSTLEQKREAIRLAVEGRSFKDVARELDISPLSVSHWVRAAEKRTGQKIAPRQQSFTLEKKREAILLAAEGRRFSDVARELDISLSSVSNWVRAEEQRTGQKIAPRKQSFTLEKKREAILLAVEGRSFTDVARELDISLSSVSNWVRVEEQRTGQKIAPRKQRFTLGQKREIVCLIEEGKSFSDVARELNTAPTGVCNWVRAEEQRTGQKIAPRQQSFTLEQKRKVVRLIREGRSIAEVKRESNASPGEYS